MREMVMTAAPDTLQYSLAIWTPSDFFAVADTTQRPSPDISQPCCDAQATFVVPMYLDTEWRSAYIVTERDANVQNGAVDACNSPD